MADPGPAPVATPITINASATRAVLTALVRQFLAWIGAYLVTKGFVPQQYVDTFIGQFADQIVGGVLMLGAAGWAWWKANHTHSIAVTLGTAVSNRIAIVK